MNERDHLIDRLAALDGEAVRPLYIDFGLLDLKAAVASAEAARAAIARHGRLGAIWNDARASVVDPTQLED